MNDPSHQPSADEFSSAQRWFVLGLVSLDYFVLYLHRSLVNYVQPPLIADLQLTDTQLGKLQWGFFLPYAIAQVFVGVTFTTKCRCRSAMPVCSPP